MELDINFWTSQKTLMGAEVRAEELEALTHFFEECRALLGNQQQLMPTVSKQGQYRTDKHSRILSP